MGALEPPAHTHCIALRTSKYILSVSRQSTSRAMVWAKGHTVTILSLSLMQMSETTIACLAIDSFL